MHSEEEEEEAACDCEVDSDAKILTEQAVPGSAVVLWYRLEFVPW